VLRRLRSGDAGALEGWIERARSERQRLLELELAGGPVSELRVSVPNKPGIVAQVALALGEAGVNIVDMALYPAPDMQSGAVALWVAGERGAERAVELIGKLGYPVTPVADGGES
jgi:prephenate dehydrogenase